MFRDRKILFQGQHLLPSFGKWVRSFGSELPVRPPFLESLVSSKLSRNRKFRLTDFEVSQFRPPRWHTNFKLQAQCLAVFQFFKTADHIKNWLQIDIMQMSEANVRTILEFDIKLILNSNIRNFLKILIFAFNIESTSI